MFAVIKITNKIFYCAVLEYFKHRKESPYTIVNKSDVKAYIAKKVCKHYRFSAFWLRSKCSICSYQFGLGVLIVTPFMLTTLTGR